MIFNHEVECNPRSVVLEPLLDHVYGAIADPTQRAIRWLWPMKRHRPGTAAVP